MRVEGPEEGASYLTRPSPHCSSLLSAHLCVSPALLSTPTSPCSCCPVSSWLPLFLQMSSVYWEAASLYHGLDVSADLTRVYVHMGHLLLSILQKTDGVRVTHGVKGWETHKVRWNSFEQSVEIEEATAISDSYESWFNSNLIKLVTIGQIRKNRRCKML